MPLPVARVIFTLDLHEKCVSSRLEVAVESPVEFAGVRIVPAFDLGKPRKLRPACGAESCRIQGPPRFLPSFVASSGGSDGEPASKSKAKSSLGTAASGGAVFQKLRATNPEKKSIGSTATVELTMLAEAPPRTELPTVASAFCAAHISPSDLPAALRERLARIRGSAVRSSLGKHVGSNYRTVKGTQG